MGSSIKVIKPIPFLEILKVYGIKPEQYKYLTKDNIARIMRDYYCKNNLQPK